MTLKITPFASRAPLVTVEVVRDPRQAVADQCSRVRRRLRLAYEAAEDLETLAAWVDRQQVTDAKRQATVIARAIAEAADALQAIDGIEQLPTLAVLRSKRRACCDVTTSTERVA